MTRRHSHLSGVSIGSSTMTSFTDAFASGRHRHRIDEIAVGRLLDVNCSGRGREGGWMSGLYGVLSL
eukprot:3483323-Rhodomonas_salina.2